MTPTILSLQWQLFRVLSRVHSIPKMESTANLQGEVGGQELSLAHVSLASDDDRPEQFSEEGKWPISHRVLACDKIGPRDKQFLLRGTCDTSEAVFCLCSDLDVQIHPINPGLFLVIGFNPPPLHQARPMGLWGLANIPGPKVTRGNDIALFHGGATSQICLEGFPAGHPDQDRRTPGGE